MVTRLMVLAVLALPLFAERWDIVISAGAAFDSASVPGFGRIRAVSGGFGGMLNPGIALVRFGPGQLEAEIPVVVTVAGDVEILGADVAVSGPAWYVVPGARYRFWPERRVTVFGAFGVGVGQGTEANVARSGAISLRHDRRLAVGFGAGADLKIVGPLKLRAEVRNFALRLAPDQSQNRPLFLAGLGLGF